MSERLYNGILIAILVVSLGLLFFANASAITGHATSGSTSSNVTIDYYLSIAMSPELSAGIDFGTISTLGVDDYNATENDDYPTRNTTLYTINVSTDGNVAVDFCLKANAGLTTAAADVIGLGNESYYAINTTSNLTDPSIDSEFSMALTYVHAVNNTSPGNESSWRFWLDMPLAQEAGNYNNTVYFKGLSTGTASCGS